MSESLDERILDAEVLRSEPLQIGAPVDAPDRKRVFFDTSRAHEGQRAPIIPPHMRPSALPSTVKNAGKTGAYNTAFHGARLPKYAAKTLLWAPVGVFVGVWRISKWMWDLEGAGLRQHTATVNAVDDYLKLSKQRDKRVGGRAPFVWAGLVVLIVGVVLLLTVAPHWARWVALGVTLPILATLGRPADKPIVDRVTMGQRFIKLTAEQTRAALVACGAGIKQREDIEFPRDIYRDEPGWTAIVNLPPGIIAGDVIDKRDRLAAGFRLPKSQVWPAGVDGEHPGLLRIWVADRPVSSMRQPDWPLLKGGTVDYFRSFPYGFNERMAAVMWSLDQKNSLFAGIPGSGKSLAVRVVLLGAVLDPLVVPVIFELKGTGDFDDFEPLCPRGLYGSGGDEDTKRRAMGAIQWVLRECETRAPIVKYWAAKGLNSTNNVNRAMAERDPRLRPLVVVLDEIQELITDKEYGKIAAAMLTSAIKLGRALGIHIILATQRIDKESIPRGISSNVAIRMCMAATSHVEVDLVLGTGAYQRGARPTEFETATEGEAKDSGWGWRTGLGSMAPMRAAYVDNTQTRMLLRRVIAQRTELGLMPSDEDVDINPRDPLADVLNVFRAGEAHLSWPEIATRLAEQNPGVYAEITAGALSEQVRAGGVESVNGRVRVEGEPDKVLKGAKVDDLRRAIESRKAGELPW